MTDAPDGLDSIEPVARTVRFGGADIQVRPLTVGQLPAFARAIKPAFGALGSDFSPNQIVDLLADHGDSIITAISVATGINPELIRAASLDEMLALVLEVIQVNRDFLTGRLPAMLRAAASQVPGQPRPTPGPGPTAFNP
jgi:hypothetical protein